MKPQDKKPTPEPHPTGYWEARLQDLYDDLQASGLTVTVQEQLDTETFVASIPQGRRPFSKAKSLRTDYMAALYDFVIDGQSYTVRVGEQNQAVGVALKALNASGAAFITAYNPASLQLGEVHNTLANRSLCHDLKKRSVNVFHGAGRDATGEWAPEPSLLVVGIDRAEAERLARKYGQYAMLWINATGQVELVEIFDLDKAARYPLKVPPLAWVELGFNWSGEWANLRLTPTKWLNILKGGEFSKTNRAGFDGKSFKLTWGFRNGTDLYVSYGGDGGTAYDGKLTGVTFSVR